ncbi:cytochrome d ubiquinol oxidase subunit II [Novimethylophilus kurashikiensis]|uniref:Cytochrome d ubiquinol oxidase subunit II n=1 Tax=Novimethylophilus kurashikiensis TaxID=1825523 RepID=A0A2R5F481_9PROT|nr:cytochrome d ubiquinol oxidase subunit II [Novimethylophilus kurashikiensis]GBG12839.1 cytochrome d ubiquinol oxidase subunit II [Novimethylophilus kurashikiensis]
MDLPFIWAAVILFAVLMYVIMDGFDLGLGILYPWFPAKEDRDVVMNTVAPVWDGNETWLVLGGAGLLAAFPLAYSVVLSAFYLPLIFMLIGLIFRGVAFEFRFKAHEHERHFWDKAFIGGSIAATFFQGVVLGAYEQGIPVVERMYAGSAWAWVTPFSLFTGLALLVAYALLGSTWLIMKTEGSVQEQAYRLTKKLVWGLLAAIVIVCVWTPLMNPGIAQRWFAYPNILYAAPVPILTVVSAALLLLAVAKRSHAAPFLFTLALVILNYVGFGISLWPNIIPPNISIWDASSPPQSQGFTLVGALVIIPLVLAYTLWGYYVFRGKVKHGEGYH